MFQIRQDQIDAFEAAAVAQANASLAKYARERFQEHFVGKPEAELLTFVAGVRESAKNYQVTAEADVATALDLTVMYGTEFYNAVWARDVFDIEGWDGGHKMNILRQRVRSQVPEF